MKNSMRMIGVLVELRALCVHGPIMGAGQGHWVQQEQPEKVSKLLIEFLQRARAIDKSDR